jgi:mRNA-degrading endonuclease toxin of MazEF toxin-antitoxin module
MEMEKENDFNINDTHQSRKLSARRGEIFWCYLGINVGSEQNGAGYNLVRPVVVINIFVDTFLLVAPLTTKYHKGDWYAKISFNNSIVILNQIRPIDSERLRNYIGIITDKELKYIIDRYIDLIKYS